MYVLMYVLMYIYSMFRAYIRYIHAVAFVASY